MGLFGCLRSKQPHQESKQNREKQKAVQTGKGIQASRFVAPERGNGVELFGTRAPNRQKLAY